MSSPFKIAVSEPIDDDAIKLLQKKGEVTVFKRGELKNRNKLIRVLKQSDAFLSMLSDKLDGEILSQAKNLIVIANYAVGYNNIDTEAAKKLGIHVANTPDVLTNATADLAVGLMIALARRFPAAEKYLREGKFNGWDPLGFRGIEISESSVGIIGMGRIGFAFANRVREFGAKIFYHNRKRVASETEEMVSAAYVPELEVMLSECDIISLHCPLTESTRHLINRDNIQRLKPHAILINTARGPVVDEEALAEALHKGNVGGAGFDVYEKEPEIHPKLLSAPNCILLPHIGSATWHARKKMGFLAAEAIINILDQKPREEIPNLIV